MNEERGGAAERSEGAETHAPEARPALPRARSPVVRRPPSLLSRLVWGVLRIGSAGHGRAIGVLSVWRAWEDLTNWWWQPRRIRPGGLLKYVPRQHTGPAVVLRDGTVVRPGDPILELHFDNRALVRLATSAGWTPWHALRLIAEDLAELARLVAEQPNGKPVAVHGITLLARPGVRLGFEYRPLPRTAGWALVHYFLVGLLAVYHPRGWRGALRVREHAWPGELWLSRDALLRRHAR